MTSPSRLTTGTSSHRQLGAVTEVPAAAPSFPAPTKKLAFQKIPRSSYFCSQHLFFSTIRSRGLPCLKGSHHVLTFQRSTTHIEHLVNKQAGRCAIQLRLLNRLSPDSPGPPPIATQMEEGIVSGLPSEPPPLPYSLHTRKRAIAIFWTIFVVDTLGQPLILYWTLWYLTDLSHNLGMSDCVGQLDPEIEIRGANR